MVIDQIKNSKGKKKITMLTCYDFSFAGILANTPIDMVLVGDSLANVMLGLTDTKQISFREMLNHTKAVRKALPCNIAVIADMPFCSYQKNPRQALYYAQKFVELAGADGVKIEWFKRAPEVIKNLVDNNISVMGHIGLTPQTADKLGGFKVQGKDLPRAKELINQAKILEEIGVFSIILECVPDKLAEIITNKVSLPTIGIGAGPNCDGQVLVLYDLLGLYPGKRPKFVRVYKDLSIEIIEAVKAYIQDVENNLFPGSKESFTLSEQVYEQLIHE